MLDTIMPFGKHQGSMIEDIIDDDPDYMAWMYENDIVTFDLEVIRKLEDNKVI